MPAKIIDGVKIANQIKEKLKVEIEELKKKGRSPSLSAIQVGENPGSRVYI
ncbi:bifunctional 5,10-methylenetetrahydrofolate dehydrogenase/5,10-methenyltetrahydrofolate cyclohydrolase, partial [Candidatus Aerophobetes bacterium]|nr:bifunctional 5,10-methylenetetrahydrofolate dehydrogenase/5,10-methenyltetrahydrofolate cyclohydrolase [Candidatus Aerophobetes bacterium]